MSIRLRLVDGSGNLPANPHDVSVAQPPVGVYSDGSMKVKGDISVTATAEAAAPSLAAATLVVWDDVVAVGVGAAAVISGVSLLVRAAIIHAPSTNTGTIYVGPNNSCRIPLTARGAYNVVAISGGVFDLNSWWYNATAPDTVHVLYVQ